MNTSFVRSLSTVATKCYFQVVDKKKRQSGATYYKKLGLTKSLVVFLTPRTAIGLGKIAKYEERAAQTVLRRAIEQYVAARLREIEKLGGEQSQD